MKMKKRLLSLLLCGAMLFSSLPATAFAEGSENGGAAGLCEHHPEHTEDCGYTEGTPGTPCGHEHTEDCYALVTKCIHEHTADCYPVESVSANTATPSGADMAEPTECSHECSKESGCITKELDCKHEHDSECGYVPATKGTPCGYVCEICNPQSSGQPEDKPLPDEDKCICTELCTGENINGNCPVCGADDADLSVCKGQTEPEEPDCTCEVLCAEGAVNTECAVCSAEGADLSQCKGSQEADGAVKNVQEQINALPTADELAAMSLEEQQAVYTKLQAAYEAYNALSDEQKAEVTGAEIFDSLFAVFASMTNTLTEEPEEQFPSLTPGETYWFDLSDLGIPGKVNTGNDDGALTVPDTTLTWVPFTYAGTVNAYKLTSAQATTEEYANSNKYDHSLFIADYAVTHTIGRGDLYRANMLFGSAYQSGGVDYSLRTPSGGSGDNGNTGENTRGTPETNEWDAILDKDSSYIQNYSGIYSWGQDTHNHFSLTRVLRGYNSARSYYYRNPDDPRAHYGFRPVLEILNPDALGPDGLQVVTVELNGGKAGTTSTAVDGPVNLVVKSGKSFAAPSGVGLTAPDGKVFDGWLGSDGQTYTPDASVPASVTTLTAQWENTPVSYISYYWDENAQELVQKDMEVKDYTLIDNDSANINWNTGYYVVTGEVNLSERVTVTGDVHLILKDNCTLTASKGITVADDDNDPSNGSPNSLTIYAQSEDERTMGALNVSATLYDGAGIGGNYGSGGGTITIHGGSVTAKGSWSAGIGGGGCGCGGTITIYGGRVTARSESGTDGNSAGIGGGYSQVDADGGSGGIITIRGGIVEAESTEAGAGIGGGSGWSRAGGSGGQITITGGTVTAKAKWGAGIGGGDSLSSTDGKGGTITISGGTVVAVSTNGRGIGNGGGERNDYDTQLTIDGSAVIFATGKVQAIGNTSDDDRANWNAVVFEGVTYDETKFDVKPPQVTITESSVIIPEKGGLTIGENGTVIVGEQIVLTSNGEIMNNGAIEGNTDSTGGTLDGTGELTGTGTIASSITNNLRKDADIKITFDQTAPVYGSTVTITAQVSKLQTNALTRALANQVEFFVGTDSNKQSLGTAPVTGNTATLSNVTILADKGWVAGENTVTAEYGGSTVLKPGNGTAKLTVTCDHSHNTNTDDKDCTTAEVCSVCNKEITAAKKDHEPEDDDGNCLTPVKCKKCDMIAIKAQDAHDFTNAVASEKYLKSAATCTAQAVYYKSCINCVTSSEGTVSEATFTSGNVDPDNHINTEVRDRKDPTATEEGYTGDLYCKDCGKLLEQGSVVPATEFIITFDGNGGTSPAPQTTTGKKLTSLPTSTQSGYSFNGWYSAKAGGDKITLDTVFSASMTVYAQWTKNSGGGGSGSSSSSGGGSSSDSGSSVTTRPDQNNPDTPTTGQTTPVKPGTDGNASIDSSIVQDAINKATADVKKNGNTANGIAVAVPIQNAVGAQSLTITIPAETLDKLVSAKVRRFDITTNGLPSFGFTLDTLKMLDTQSQGGDLILRMVKTTAASNAAKEAIGTRPAYDISLVYVKNGVETPLTDWQGKTISVKLSYTPAENEQTGNLYAVYVDGNGKVEWLAKSSYDPDQKAVLFEAEHFSIYGVGYKAPAPAFTDISGHWAEQHILFAAGRGLLNGTGNNQFSPNTGMTRGMFVTALGRLAGIDPADYQTGKFTDVPEDAYYAPYVNWAAQNGIVSGTTATSPAIFSPDSSITRQEMAVIMKNYAAKMGCTLPKTLEAVTFTDHAQISSWATDAVRAMQQAGILAGKDGGRFDPKGTATRAEAATVLHRFVEVVIDPQTANGWVQNDSGDWYYYRDGEPVKGWLSDEQKWYWLDQSSGKMFAGGWKQIDGKRYYFYANGVMAVNTTIEGYAIGSDGAAK